jgi:hypothetical protein
MGRSSLSFLSSLLGLLCVFSPFHPAGATTVVPVLEQALVEDAVAIVTGDVTRIESFWDAQQEKIFTHVSLSVEEILKGDFDTKQLILKQIGGQVSGLYAWVYGNPEFSTGERVLLFLSRNPDRTLRVAHLFQGKFSIFFDANSGEEVVYRQTPEGVHVLSAPAASKGAAPHHYEIHRLSDYKNRIRTIVQKPSQSRSQRPSAEIVLLPQPFSAATEIQEKFTFLGAPSRWFEPDSFNPVTIFINSAGEPLAPTSGFDQVRAGLQAWSNVVATNFRFQDGGFTTASGLAQDGINAVSFRDPLGQIDNPVDCGGILALGGFLADATQTRIVNGQTFRRIERRMGRLWFL